MYTLKVKVSDEVKELYKDHSTFHEGDSGYDLFMPQDMNELVPGETYLVDLGFKAEMVDEKGNNVTYILCPRSSVYKTPFRQSNSVGVIDAGYRGNIKVPIDVLITKNDFLNKTLTSQSLDKGRRLFQLCAPDYRPFKVELVDELSKTSRGEGGFGSTGK